MRDTLAAVYDAQVAGAMIDPAKTREDRMAALPGILRFYARWYPPLWLQGVTAPLRYGEWGALANGGRLMEPRLEREVWSPEGKREERTRRSAARDAAFRYPLLSRRGAARNHLMSNDIAAR